MGENILLYCVRFLNRHPSEVDLTLQQIAEVAYIGDMIFEREMKFVEAITQTR